MSTKKKPAKKKAPPSNMVRKLIPRTAVIYTPGQGIPQDFQRIIDHAKQAAVNEYKMFLNTQSQVMPAGPTDVNEAAKALQLQLRELPYPHQVHAIGIFLDQFTKGLGKDLNASQNMVAVNEARVESIQETIATLGNILTGNYSIIDRPKITNANNADNSKS